MTKQISKQNITRDIEIKNKLTVTRDQRGGERGTIGEGSSRNINKRHMNKAKGGKTEGGLGRSGGRDMETTIFEQQ